MSRAAQISRRNALQVGSLGLLGVSLPQFLRLRDVQAAIPANQPLRQRIRSCIQQGKNWDTHKDNFRLHKDYLLPPADQAFAALIEDLDRRGLLDTTLVVAVGEFGRTPRINQGAGRDHWPDCYTALLAGGPVKGGYVHGASDRLGAYPDADPVTPADLAATIFTLFGSPPPRLCTTRAVARTPSRQANRSKHFWGRFRFAVLDPLTSPETLWVTRNRAAAYNVGAEDGVHKLRPVPG